MNVFGGAKQTNKLNKLRVLPENAVQKQTARIRWPAPSVLQLGNDS